MQLLCFTIARNLQSVLDGDLDRVLDPLILADREEKLKANKGDA